ncbi:MAG: sigma 54-interacting transcriptional regulator [Desulfomonile sp.]|nr:sigma 54-interacting transcriptional regulator [Desulfomonile sp.]
MKPSSKPHSAQFVRNSSNPRMRSRREDPLEELELLRLILDNIYNGVLVTDADGYVTYFNEPYGKFLGVDPAEQIGKHCTEVVENSRMHIVAKTGVAEINDSHLIRGQRMVVQRIPIKKNDRVIAVFGQVMFKDVRDVGKLAQKLSILESKVDLYERELISLRSTRYTLDSIVGVSEIIADLKRQALKAAATHLPVLLTGESGTGKELFAQAIHHASMRRLHSFVRINCAAIPRDLLESELFGYEHGAFTGAQYKGKPGKFEMAHHGTIFLDEIGDLPLEMQPKLLQVLEQKEVERIGGTSVTRVDFRVIAATNQDLEHMVAEGTFRKDLFYRLNVMPLHIPPLRKRPEDIVPLARHLLYEIVRDSSLTALQFLPRTEQVLQEHDWPGNGRELFNVLQRVSSSVEGELIRPHDLPLYLRRGARSTAEPARASLKDLRSRSEEDAIRDALTSTGNNKAKAAEMLGIHRTLLYKKMHKYGIPLDQSV